MIEPELSKRITTEQAQKAATWWAEQISGGSKLDNGDPSETGVMTFVLGKHLQQLERQELTDEKIKIFIDSLSEILVTENPWAIGVDYGPDFILSQAADKAGIPTGGTLFPWKTCMYFRNGEIKVSCGYGASPVSLE